MRNKKIYSFIISLIMFLALSINNVYIVQAETDNELNDNGQPYVSAYFPNELLEWDKDSDEDLKYNISYIPLSERVKKENLTQTNTTQNKEAKLLVISSLNASTSGNFSQGSNEFMKKGTNMYSYWQYADTLIYWGGSAGEGIIVPPSADVIDEAHRNGVPVLGTVFFAPEVYGGKIEWFKQMMQKNEDGSFPAADKLIELASIIHFDGWFFNQETEGTTEEDALILQQFIKYIKQKAPQLKIYYYDAMTKDGSIDWQNALTDQNQMFLKDENMQNVADAMFLNFWWTNDSQKDKELLKLSNHKAYEIGVDPYDVYAGVDVEANGYNTPIRWNLFENDDTTYTSLGLFKPSWTYESAIGNTKEDREADFSLKESKFWINEFGNPTRETQAVDRQWKGMSHYFIENSPITETSFNTNFSMGQGKAYYVDGKKVSSSQWNNRSMQNIMPTYRFIINNDGETNMIGSVDYNTVYNGGSSISFDGNLDSSNPAQIKLFASDVLVTDKTNISIIAKSRNPVKIDLILDFDDDTNDIIECENEVTDWTENIYELKDYAGKRIRVISYKISSENDQNAKINIGNFCINDGSNISTTIDNPKIEKVYSNDGITAGVRLDLGQKYKTTDYYEIYRITENGKELCGVTVNPHYYIGNIKRENKQKNTTFEINAVSTTGKRSEIKTVMMSWNDYPKPEAKFTADKTYVTPETEVKFINQSSDVSENFVWTFEGANISTSTEINPIITYKKSGVYSVTLTASNVSGEDKYVCKNFIVVNEKANDIKNLALNKPTQASSYVNDNEADIYAVDDSIKTKWCAVGDEKHTITINLEKDVTISQIDIAHAEAGGEGSIYNTKGFSIYTSKDGETFELATTVLNNTSAISHTPIKPTLAKYLKIVIDKATQSGDTAARIYDIQIFGTEE